MSEKEKVNPEPVVQSAAVVSDFDGNVYPTIRIGNQTWMAENLRSTHYSDGTPVDSQSYENSEANADQYGRLYTREAIMRGASSSSNSPSGVQGIAPAGWHIPSREEWNQLLTTLGGHQVAGGKLKELGPVHWAAPNTGASNESLMAVLPAGMLLGGTTPQWLGTHAVFTTSEYNSRELFVVILYHDNEQAAIEGFFPGDAVSVRCVKNE